MRSELIRYESPWSAQI